jgi:hypothetical protein
MTYRVRVPVQTNKVLPFNDLLLHAGPARLVSGSGEDWNHLEILNSNEEVLASLKRVQEEEKDDEIERLRDGLRNALPLSAREWVKNYLSEVKTIFIFELNVDNISGKDWEVLGRFQNMLKDALQGIVQADHEGYYNEKGDYILWQMYEGAGGTIPAAVLDQKGSWIPFNLKLNKAEAVQRFKEGIVPQKSFLSRILKI